jgi:hypothetical protein
MAVNLSISIQKLYYRITHFMISEMENLDMFIHGDRDTDVEPSCALLPKVQYSWNYPLLATI